MIPCISEACTMPSVLAEYVATCAESGFTAMQVWQTKLETHLESHDAIDVQRMIADKGISLIAAAYQGGLLLSQGEARRTHFDHFRRRLELCEVFKIPTMIVVADFQRRPQQIDLERAVVSLAEAARWAAGFNVRIALE